MELRKYWEVALRWWWLLLLCTLFAGRSDLARFTLQDRRSTGLSGDSSQRESSRPPARGFEFSSSSVSAGQQMNLRMPSSRTLRFFLGGGGGASGLPAKVVDEARTITIKPIPETR